MTLEDNERQCHEALESLRREYELRARPWINQLIRIQNVRMPEYRITAEQLALLVTPQNMGSNLNKPTEHNSGCAVYDITRPELGECSCGFDPR